MEIYYMNIIVKNTLPTLVFLICFFTTSISIAVDHDTIDCSNDSLQSAIDDASPGDTISVKGVCNESIVIKTDDLTLIGDMSDSNAKLSGELLFFATMIKIDSAVRLTIRGFDIVNGLTGVDAKNGASFSLIDSSISGMIVGGNFETNTNALLKNVVIENSSTIGLDVKSGSTVTVVNSFTIVSSSAFGLEVLDGAELKVTENSNLTLTGNLLGAQIAGGSTMFIDTDSTVNADNNILIGLSINTGSSVVMFNSDMSANGNGLDGLDIISSSNLDVDGNSTLTVNNNRREGISLDDGSLNIFGFFSSEPGLPKITANGNTNNGIQLEFGGKLDIGRNSSLETMNNGMAGVSLDNGSSAIIHDSVIQGNNGVLLDDHAGEHGSKHRDDDANEHGPADIVATFGSRISFQGNNDIGLVLCDRTSISRGDIRCRR